MNDLIQHTSTKYCYACKQSLPISFFNKNKAKKDGLGTQCKVCNKKLIDIWMSNPKNRNRHKAKTVSRRRNNKQKLVELFGGKCLDCQGVFPNCCYDFHHLDYNEKDYSLGNIGSYSWKVIEKEVIGKCVMLCSNCHRIRHHAAQ